jgi:glycosyltransferase involved in cell wall biosynthesis
MQGETILCVESASRWDALWRDSQQIMSRIAAQNRVLFFEPGRHHEAPASAEFVRNVPNFFKLNCVQRQQNLYIIPTPSSLPYLRRHLPRSILRYSIPLVSKINNSILIRQIRWAMKALDVEEPILWLYGPTQIDLIGKFGEKAVCYFNYDEHADFVHNSHIRDLMHRWDQHFSSQVDLIFATSQAQTERRKAVNPNTFFIPNGVDFELFNRALAPDLPLPPDIARIPRPIIGFAGWLGYHIDVALLLRIARSYPDCSVVFVGPEELPKGGERAELYTLPNVHFLGRKERTDLPNYLQAFDVALMPWALRGHILSAYPLKLHEYLAAGRASVATALPELRPYAHVIRIAESHDDFIAHIRAALHDNSPQAIAARVAVARENTWDRRVADMYRILESHLHNRPTSQPGPADVRQLVHG